MPSAAGLRAQLLALDRRGYRAYRDIEGQYRFERFTLHIDHAQSDPFAPPSRLRAVMPLVTAAYPPGLLTTPVCRIALADYLARVFAGAIQEGGVRALAVDVGGQTVLERTAVAISALEVELRFTARLPAAGRSILGREAATLLTDVLPRLIERSLPFAALDAAEVRRHLETVEDAQALRGQLTEHRLVAFVADGSILPRASGARDVPLRQGAVPFRSPPELAVRLTTPHSGEITGMGIPAGTTLIVGGGYHGKSTLLRAIQQGVYDHIPGDGRERVVTVANAVKIRAEDGRSVERVDISPFLSNLPSDVDTSAFSTDNASGSTSMAAGIMEALEAGTSLLLLDEDTSATNFLVRDALMRQLVPRELEPITPHIDRVAQLVSRGISTILALGGNGEYFAVADHVILMQAYEVRDVTAEAHRIATARSGPTGRRAPGPFDPPIPRAPLPVSVDAAADGGRTPVRARHVDEIRLGREEIDLSLVEQIVDPAQTRAIGQALLRLAAAGYIDGRRSLAEALDALEADIDASGLPVLLGRHRSAPPGDLARPRRQEMAAALNRLRSLRVRQV